MNLKNKRLPRTEAELDEFCVLHGLRPYGKVEDTHATIYLAETDLEIDRHRRKAFPWGYYQTAWFVQASASNGKFDGGSWLEFDAMHDSAKGWSNETRREKRIEAALAHARQWIDKNVESKRYG